MTVLIDHIKTLDEELLNNLINIVNPKYLSNENNTEIIDKPRYVVDKMYSLLGLDKDVHKQEYFEKQCFKVTVKKLKIKNIDWDDYDPNKIILDIYLKFRANAQLKLSKISKTKIKEISSDIKNQLEFDGKALTDNGLNLSTTLAAGEAAGFALFTGTAVGLKAIGSLTRATLPFGAYGVSMSTLGIVFGPVGFISAGGVIAGSVIKAFIGKKRNKVISAIITIIIDMKEKEENIFNNKHFKYSQELLDESKRFLSIDILNNGNYNHDREKTS
ncbi:MAG: hypothetical protein HOK35_13710 [Cytophagia bacterium]|nr:hypothetical protein [Cytophagia bacterium]